MATWLLLPCNWNLEVLGYVLLPGSRASYNWMRHCLQPVSFLVGGASADRCPGMGSSSPPLSFFAPWNSGYPSDSALGAKQPAPSLLPKP